MGKPEIDLNHLKTVVNAIVDHLLEDLDIQTVAIEEDGDFYWTIPPSEEHDISKKPSEMVDRESS